MNPSIWYALVGAGLFGLGLHSLVLAAHVLRKIIALNLMGAGTFLILVALSRRLPGSEDLAPDPVPQAMVLTGIVVAVSATAMALALLRRYFEATGNLVLPENTRDWGCEAPAPVPLPAEPAEEPEHGH